MRGLKQSLGGLMGESASVASFTDAWIETETWSRTANLDAVASFTDAWIETQIGCIRSNRHSSHLLQMRGLKLKAAALKSPCASRIFYRCVD